MIIHRKSWPVTIIIIIVGFVGRWFRASGASMVAGNFRPPLAELSDFMTIAARRDTTPLPAMILGRVVKIEDTSRSIRAAMKIGQIGLGQKMCDLAGN